MRPDVDRYQGFYNTLLGKTVAKLITDQLASLVKTGSGQSLALMGYGVPYAQMLVEKGADVLMLMPESQGAHAWLGTGKANRVAIVADDHLPLPDCSLDGLILVHALEHVSRPNRFLRELWRVLKPGGHITLIVPNRRSSWAAFETTPFAYGRPWSKGQLYQFLRDHLFTPRKAVSALVLPPLLVPSLAGLMETIERPFKAIDAGFGGVLIVSAEKEMMGGIPIGKTQKAAAPVGVTNDRPRYRNND